MAWKDEGTQKFKNKKFSASLYFAWQGIKTVLLEERNMRFHIFAGAVALLMGYYLKLNQIEWLWLFLAIFLVLLMEIMNTIIENLVDLVTNYHFHPLAKKVKDMAAAAVLLTAVLAMIVGAVLFLPKIYNLIF